MRSLFLLALMFAAILSGKPPGPEQVEGIIGFIRHGARREQKQLKEFYPRFGVYPDPNIGIGDLTQTGMRQMYMLGKTFAGYYPHLFGMVADGYQVKAHASTYNRTINSAHCFFNGVYDLGSGLDLESDVKANYLPPIPGFDPVFEGKSALPLKASLFPVETPSFPGNIYLTPDSDLTCPPMNSIRKKNEAKMNTDFTPAFEPLYRKFKELGFEPRVIEKDRFDFMGAYELCDMIVSRAYNDPDFKHYDESVIEQCVHLTTFYGFKVNSGDYLYGVNQKLNERVIAALEDFANGVQPRIRSQIFFSHDTNLESFWGNFFPEHWQCVMKNYQAKYGDKASDGDFFDASEGESDAFCMDLVRFTANIVMEIYQEKNEWKVNFRFNNKPVFLPGEVEPVSLKKIVHILKQNTRPDWDNMCLPTPYTERTSTIVYWVFAASIVLAVIAVATLYVASKRYRLQANQDVRYEAI